MIKGLADGHGYRLLGAPWGVLVGGLALALLLLALGALPIRHTHIPRFRVLVTDDKGNPLAGAQIHVAYGYGTKWFLFGYGRTTFTWDSTTNGDGLAYVEGGSWWWGDYFQGKVVVEKEGYVTSERDIALGSSLLVEGELLRVHLGREGYQANEEEGAPVDRTADR